MAPTTYETSFSRNLGILTREEQRRLSQSCAGVVGLGGIGGNTAVTLARMGVGRFRLADFDSFELANINRQHGATVETVGHNKAAVVAADLQRINPAVRVDVFHEGFTEANGDAVLEGADLVVDAVDFYAIETHLALHRKTRAHGLYTLMGSPVGFSACLQIFDPDGMSLEEYCGIEAEMSPLEKQLRYACGLVPELAHIEYFDVSTSGSNTDFNTGTGPSVACACSLAAALVATEAALLLVGRRPPRCIPFTFQFDPYTFRYEKTFVDGGMTRYDPTRAIQRIPDRSSLVPQVFEFLYHRTRAERVRVNGAELYFREEGTGETVVLIAPLGADSSFWARQVVQLAKRYRVITFDARGSGVSTPCPAECSIEVLADDAAALLAHLDVEQAHVVGLALGGLVAQRLAFVRPDLVSSMVLMSSYAAPDEHIRRVTDEWRSLAVSEGMEPLFDTCLEWLFTDNYVAKSREEVDKLKTYFRLIMQDPSSFCAQSLAGTRHDARPWLNELRCPTLVLHGSDDRLVAPELGRLLASLIPGARFELVPGAPHFMTWEHTDRVNGVIIAFIEAIKGVDGDGRATRPAQSQASALERRPSCI